MTTRFRVTPWRDCTWHPSVYILLKLLQASHDMTHDQITQDYRTKLKLLTASMTKALIIPLIYIYIQEIARYNGGQLATAHLVIGFGSNGTVQTRLIKQLDVTTVRCADLRSLPDMRYRPMNPLIIQCDTEAGQNSSFLLLHAQSL